MSERNVELLRRAIEAYNTRDLAAFVAYFDPGTWDSPMIFGVAEPRVLNVDDFRTLLPSLEDVFLKLTGHSSADMNAIYSHHELATIRAALDHLPRISQTGE